MINNLGWDTSGLCVTIVTLRFLKQGWQNNKFNGSFTDTQKCTFHFSASEGQSVTHLGERQLPRVSSDQT